MAQEPFEEKNDDGPCPFEGPRTECCKLNDFVIRSYLILSFISKHYHTIKGSWWTGSC
jgi:hypothetical protein